MPHAVFFDRDGIVNVRRVGDYVTTWEEFQFLPEVFSALPRVHALGYLAIVATNQRGVSLGRMSLHDVEVVHSRMQEELRTRTGNTFDDILVCPHDNDAGCDCRKPLPGLLLSAAAKWDIDLAASWMIGDGERDVVAGNRAGCRSILVGPETTTAAGWRVDTLAAAVDIIAGAA